METVTVADLVDFFNGARPDAPVFLNLDEWAKAGEQGHVLEVIVEAIRESKSDHIDAL